MSLADNIRCVMIGTTHPGNIGAAARALKTMGYSQLDLVAPRHFPHPDAIAMASGAEELFEKTRLFATLEEAVADCGVVIGLTARSRRLASEVLTVRECCARVIDEAEQHPVALVYGRENSGLSNDELNRCHYHVHIPANPEYSSLNIASAVQIMAYELRAAWLEKTSTPNTSPIQIDEPHLPAPQAEVDRLVEHLEGALRSSGFLDPGNPRRLMYRLRRFFQRARPDQNEVNIWRGILTSFERCLKASSESENK